MKIVITIAVILIAALGTLIFRQRDTIFRYEPSGDRDQSAPLTQATNNIFIDSPQSGQKITNPITIKGRARVFENTLNYRLKDSQGNILYESFGIANAPDIGHFGNFEVKIPVPVSAPARLVVEVFNYSARDASEENITQVQVIRESLAVATTRVFFSNNELNSQNNCARVFPVDHQIAKTIETGYAALLELLKGPTEIEKIAGYSTNIPDKVRINSLVIRDGIAFADFDHTLESGVAGSCRVTAIRSQIIETLKQFPSVQNVVISINGRTEDILQP